MSDFFVELGRKPLARKVIQTLGLPIPLPQYLARASGPWEDRFMDGETVVVGHLPSAVMASALASCLSATGATLIVKGTEEQSGHYGALSNVTIMGDEGLPGGIRPRALVFDATGIDGGQDLRAVYAFFHGLIKKLSSCGRVILVSRPPAEYDKPEAAAAARALEGFARSIAREAGRKGTTAQTVYVSQNADDRLEPALRFLLSKHAAYISGQPVHLSAVLPCPDVVPHVQPLKNKTALVTGAARGIGAATARALAREGAHVICMDRPEESALTEQVASEIRGSAFNCDVTGAEAPEKASKYIADTFGGVDIVVHNAGVTRDKTLGNMDAARWDTVLGVNLIGLIALNNALMPQLKNNGRIICLSSVGGITGNAGQTNYAASKAGVIGYVQALAPGLAERGISVNAVAPGFIETAMTAAMPFGTRQVARRLCNLSQGGQPEDVAEAVTFLASPGAAGLTGQVLRVCGGNYVGA
jgi:3-oxoacyl-[acyl-carrier protein] reductase